MQLGATVQVGVILLSTVAFGQTARAQTLASGTGLQGTVRAETGDVLPGVSITATNTATGAARFVVTNIDGYYNFLLLPIGIYEVVAHQAGFEDVRARGVSLRAGKREVVDFTLPIDRDAADAPLDGNGDSASADLPRGPGDPERPRDTPDRTRGRVLTRPGDLEAGRTFTARELAVLPFQSRNPYNLLLLVPGVSGTPAIAQGAPKTATNGLAGDGTFLLNGNSAVTAADADLPALPGSIVTTEEARIVTLNPSPDYGRTLGFMFDTVPPSGSRERHGEARYEVSRDLDQFSTAIGGALQDVGYYAGAERSSRDLDDRFIRMSPAESAALGIAPPLDGFFGEAATATSFIGRGEYQVARASHLAVRFVGSRTDAPLLADARGLTTLDRASNGEGRATSTAVHLNTFIGGKRLNELRLQFAGDERRVMPADRSSTGPAVDVLGFRLGTPPIGGSIDPRTHQSTWQLGDTFTFIRGNHTYEVGFDQEWRRISQSVAPAITFTFPSLDAYEATRSGVDPLAYSIVSETSGGPDVVVSSASRALFAQDKWQIRPRLTLELAVRYDRSQPSVLAAAPREPVEPSTPTPAARRPAVDGNNVSPRAGFVWAAGEASTIRGSSGIVFDRLPLGAYARAARWSATAPHTLVVAGPTSSMPSIVTIAPGFDLARSWQNQIRYDRLFQRRYNATILYRFAQHANLPAIVDVNVENPIGSLADGRPVFSSRVAADTRRDPRFDHNYEVQSSGSGHYQALSIGLAARRGSALSVHGSYTLAKAVDDVNPEREDGRSALDVRHTFVADIVYDPSDGGNMRGWRSWVAGNRIGLTTRFATGVPITIHGSRDLDGDGRVDDLPLFVERRPLSLPAWREVNLRVARDIRVASGIRVEIAAEIQNLFDSDNVVAVDSTLAVDALGRLTGPIPAVSSSVGGAEGAGAFRVTEIGQPRQFQLGFAIRF